jgi:two-component system, cell cycle response regulator
LPADPRNRELGLDLERVMARIPGPQEFLLARFDLDGFTQYSATFGAVAGAALLGWLHERLADVMRRSGSACGRSGDEFFMLARCAPAAAEELLEDALTALEDRGEAWRIRCSSEVVWAPSEASTPGLALKLARECVSATKIRCRSAGRQVADAMIQAVAQQSDSLDEHVKRVSDLCADTAKRLGLSEHEVRRICLAAKLHDLGKNAIPTQILDKPGPLDEREWGFMRRHTLIGERIALAAPGLASAAALIRSSHERLDGDGYPDGLSGESIPLGSRIIAVCDAYDAMTTDRSYRPSIGAAAAARELAASAGSQFDAIVVGAFCKIDASVTVV